MKTWRFLILALGFGLVTVSLFVAMKPAEASQNASQNLQADNFNCLYCHARPDLTMTMPSGEIVSLTINDTHFSASVHNGLACTDCHTEITGYPHPEFNQQTVRDVSMKWYTSCQECHAEQYNQTLDSVHQKALAAGNTNAAICTDCHNPHTQSPITGEAGKILPEARLHIPQTCARCHSAIYEQYKSSVHGAALTAENNPDVPTCIDCHGVHNIEDPTTAAFRLASPTEMCGRCHTNPDIMDKYGISTNVLNTYVADFHGTTVTLFEKTSPDQAVNKPVCFDCHGVHDIKAVDDPQKGFQVKENILVACQKCHPDATTNFPDAWLSHYIPDRENYPIVYYVNLFYKIFIPLVLGGMGVFVITDIFRRLINRWKGAKH